MRIIYGLMAVVGLVVWGYLSAIAQNADCPANYEGFLAPRLQVGARGIVVPGGSGNRVRIEPSTGAEQVGTMSPGTQFDIVAGPYCDSSALLIWWQVHTDDDLDGWTAEGLPPDDYFLEPANLRTFTATPSQTPTRQPTATPTVTATAVQHSPLDLPERAILSPDNASRMAVIGQIPMTGRAVSLFMSPDMDYLFVIFVSEDFINFANVYTFPELRPVAQSLPNERILTFGARSGKPAGLFTGDSRFMAAVQFGYWDVTFYEPGAATFVVDHEGMRSLDVADLSDAGILALGMVRYSNDGRTYMLCFVDKVGDVYAPDDRLCLPQEAPIQGLAFLPDESRLLAGTTKGLTLYEVPSGEILSTFDYRIESGGTLAIIANHAESSLPVVFLSNEGFVLSVNLDTREERTYLNGAGQVARQIIARPDGAQMMFIVPTSNVPDVFVVNIATKAELHREALYSGEGVAYSPDGKLAFINNAIYETETWQMLHQLRGDQHILEFSPDGTMLFVRNTTDKVFEIYGISGP